MKTALLISTYNWPEALELILLSLLKQSKMPDEVLIADDGSTEKTAHLIAEFQKKTMVPLRHFWQEDNGFRKSKILNKAIAESSADYIIQIDGDCIMHPDFIKDHFILKAENNYLYGSRVNIQEEKLDSLFKQKQISFSFFASGIKKRTRNIRLLPLAKMYKSQSEVSRKFRGCNVSYWKKDFIAINGYDESFEGWGREDSEMIIRMANTGVMGKRIRYAGIVYHIFHKTASQNRLEVNDKLQKKTVLEKKIWCENGVNKYL